ncbi:MAG: hypothetical protein M1562_02690 [Candidatus Marsarchaeota archaeon]|nr:hypothetical protein [Candidatus Marsarchaeota archaeon]
MERDREGNYKTVKNEFVGLPRQRRCVYTIGTTALAATALAISMIQPAFSKPEYVSFSCPPNTQETVYGKVVRLDLAFATHQPVQRQRYYQQVVQPQPEQQPGLQYAEDALAGAAGFGLGYSLFPNSNYFVRSLVGAAGAVGGIAAMSSVNSPATAARVVNQYYIGGQGPAYNPVYIISVNGRELAVTDPSIKANSDHNFEVGESVALRGSSRGWCMEPAKMTNLARIGIRK